MNDSLHLLIIEDEQHAAAKLKHHISRLEPKANMHWVRGIADAIDYLKMHNDIALVFSDIELIDGNAFQIYDEITPSCPIIFCTAYDQFYMQAFQTSGIAYLLKPWTEEDFDQAWNKYKGLFQKASPAPLSAEFLHQIKGYISNEPSYKSTFTVKKPNGVFLLKTTDIAYIQAQGDFLLAYDAKGNRHALNHTLSQIESVLDPKAFFRINRSELVAAGSILKFTAYTKNRLELFLKDNATQLYTSNSRSAGFREWLEGM